MTTKTFLLLGPVIWIVLGGIAAKGVCEYEDANTDDFGIYFPYLSGLCNTYKNCAKDCEIEKGRSNGIQLAATAPTFNLIFFSSIIWTCYAHYLQFHSQQIWSGMRGSGIVFFVCQLVAFMAPYTVYASVNDGFTFLALMGLLAYTSMLANKTLKSKDSNNLTKFACTLSAVFTLIGLLLHGYMWYEDEFVFNDEDDYRFYTAEIILYSLLACTPFVDYWQDGKTFQNASQSKVRSNILKYDRIALSDIVAN